jgi:putative membrane protein
MENNKIKTVIKSITILGLIFCIVSLLTPWSSWAFTFGIFTENHSSIFFNSFFTDESITKSSFSYQAQFFAMVMIIIFFFIIIGLIAGIQSIINFDKEKSTIYFTISSIFIINIILYIIAISIWQMNNYYIGLSYSPGFITAVIAFIIFFVSFTLKSVFYQKTANTQETIFENESIDILKTRYAKGEITKEQFEQMKKDLEK